MHHRARQSVRLLAVVVGVFVVGWTIAPASQSMPAPASAPAGTLVDGETLFQGYCAPCHGEGGRGDGPLADFLAQANRPPIDLTTIALKHDGAFPSFWVEDFIANRGRSIPQGRDAMPDWGRLFRSNSPSEAVYQLKIRNLVRYLRSIQVD